MLSKLSKNFRWLSLEDHHQYFFSSHRTANPFTGHWHYWLTRYFCFKNYRFFKAECKGMEFQITSKIFSLFSSKDLFAKSTLHIFYFRRSTALFLRADGKDTKRNYSHKIIHKLSFTLLLFLNLHHHPPFFKRADAKITQIDIYSNTKAIYFFHFAFY